MKALGVKHAKELRIELEGARLSNDTRGSTAGVNSVVKIRSKVVQAAIAHGVAINGETGQANKQESVVRHVHLSIGRELTHNLSVTMVVRVRIKISSGSTKDGTTIVQVVTLVKERSTVRRVANGRRNETVTKPDDLRPLLLDPTDGTVKLRSRALVHLARGHARALATGGTLGKRTTTFETATRHDALVYLRNSFSSR